jgi:hypothetical protein
VCLFFFGSFQFIDFFFFFDLGLFDFVVHPHISTKLLQLSGELGLEGVLEGDGIGGEFGDTLTELLDGHLVLVEVEAEEGLVIDVGLLLKVEG